MGPPIHYYGDMNMAEDQDKNNEDLSKIIDDILDEVLRIGNLWRKTRTKRNESRRSLW